MTEQTGQTDIQYIQINLNPNQTRHVICMYCVSGASRHVLGRQLNTVRSLI